MNLSDGQKEKMTAYEIPQHMHDSLIRYFDDRIAPGDFLSAVIDNDLKEAFGRADDINQHCLFAYMKWFYNEAPSGSWGYAGAVKDWIKRGPGG